MRCTGARIPDPRRGELGHRGSPNGSCFRCPVSGALECSPGSKMSVEIAPKIGFRSLLLGRFCLAFFLAFFFSKNLWHLGPVTASKQAALWSLLTSSH